ncbi:hypothetical protein DTO021D3_6823 [Paecilomyces variotii]|nr:hypothetical protein DTO032I3_751 [Paecilomyces variotii]KAJ9276337.1 hypothetical protein DTO021D3_6823 [Paecilomyces variotii]KAJ9340052.1 hypothetical protein DTO027B6_7373 [Paecilomyces variotii]KAJ9386500.1 hypothetical protein DTO032I4_3596 [Paecilomyces variotii]
MFEGKADDAQPLEDGMEIEKLDAEGDVTLVVGGNSMSPRQFLVSSKILSIASPVFAKLFGPHFLEGSQMAKHGSVTIHLDEDDAKGMGIVLGILHHQETPEIEKLSAKEIATVAICCDKYDCARVIRPWIAPWIANPSRFFGPLGLFVSAKQYGLALLAAHLLRASDEFSQMTRRAQLECKLGSLDAWDDEEILALLPRSIRRDLTKAIGDLLNLMHHELQSMDLVLRGTKPVWKGTTMCPSCSKAVVTDLERCPYCNRKRKLCTEEHRLAEYVSMLRKKGLWPSITPFQTFSVKPLANSIKSLGTNITPSCEEGRGCPVVSALKGLEERIDGIIGNVKGLSLYPLSG